MAPTPSPASSSTSSGSTASPRRSPAHDGGAPSAPFESAHRLTPGTGHRRLRRVLVILGVATAALAVVSLVVSSLVSMRAARAFPLEPTLTELGLPTALELTVDIGEVTVLTSSEVTEVTIGMAPDGARGFAPGKDVARARIQVSEGESTAVDVTQPKGSGPADLFRDASTSVLVLVPEGHELDLQMSVDAGDARIEGAFSAVEASVDVGELDIMLPQDAETPVSARVNVGDLRIAAPGSLRYDVTASASMGETRIDETMRAAAGEAATRISAEVSVGEVSVSR